MATIAQPRTLARPTVRPRETGLWSWLTTVDHKRIGILYGTTGFIMLLVGGLEALIIRLQLAVPENDLVSLNTYNELFTMHGLTMLLMAVMPMATAFFNYIVPLQIGARDVAFPRLNALSFWIFLAGAIVMNMSWLLGSAPNVGWTGYAPNSIELQGSTMTINADRNGDFYVVGLALLGIASTIAALNFIVTIINLRAPGMAMMRMPIFSWSALITNILIALSFPPVTVAAILLGMDRFVGTHFYVPAVYENGALALTGGDPLLWQHLFWIFGHPEVYILILPAFGIISEVIPVNSRKPLFGYPVMVYALGAIAFLGFGVWAHHMFTTGLGAAADAAFGISTMLIAIPTGIKIFNWVGTMWGGQIRFNAPMLFAVGFVSQFVIGGISGIMHSSAPVDVQQQDSYFVVAHFHYVLIGGAVFGLMAGIYHWFPKVTGKVLDERIGKIHFWLTFFTFNATFFPMHFLGLAGMPRRYGSYAEESGWAFWNGFVSAASMLLGVSFLLLVWNVVKALRSPERAPDDPWDGATLEWTIPSPPPVYNFETIPTVTHRDQFWADKYEIREGVTAREEQEVEVRVVGQPLGQPVPAATESAEKEQEIRGRAEDLHVEGEHDIHMPNPSIYPFVAAVGLFIVGIGALYSDPDLRIGIFNIPVLVLIGAVIMIAGIYGWAFEPASTPVEERSEAHA